MKNGIKLLLLTAAFTILGVSSVFAAQTPEEIQQDHAGGMAYLYQINAQTMATEAALLAETQAAYERGMAELRRAHSMHADCGIEQEARAGYENGQAYLNWIIEQNKAAAIERDRQAQEGYDRGIEYLRQCGWDI